MFYGGIINYCCRILRDLFNCCSCRRRKMTRMRDVVISFNYLPRFKNLILQNGYDCGELAVNTLDVSIFNLRCVFLLLKRKQTRVRMTVGMEEGDSITNIKTQVIPGKKLKYKERNLLLIIITSYCCVYTYDITSDVRVSARITKYRKN